MWNQKKKKWTKTNKQHTNKYRKPTEQTGGCQGGGGRGLRGKKFQLQKQIVSHGDEKYSIGNMVSNIVVTLCGDRWWLHLSR